MKTTMTVGILCVLAGCGTAGPASDTAHQTEQSAPRIRTPLLDAADGSRLSALNPQLLERGLETFPDYIDVGEEDFDAWQRWFDVLDAANLALGGDIEMAWNDPPDSYKSDLHAGLCYLGDARKVPALMRELNDWVFSEFIAVYMWKYQDETHKGEAWGELDEPEDVSTYPESFRNFSGNGEDLMLVISVTDAYEERLAVQLPRCADDARPDGSGSAH